MPISDKVKQLYDALKADGGDVGSEQEFNDWFLAPGEQGYKNRKYVYDTFKADGADVGQNYEEFRDWLNLVPASPTPANVEDVRRSNAAAVSPQSVGAGKTGTAPTGMYAAANAAGTTANAADTTANAADTTAGTTGTAAGATASNAAGTAAGTAGTEAEVDAELQGRGPLKPKSAKELLDEMRFSIDKPETKQEVNAQYLNEGVQNAGQIMDDPLTPVAVRAEAKEKYDAADAVRKADRKVYDDEHFGALWDDHVAGAFTQEKQKGEAAADASTPAPTLNDTPAAQLAKGWRGLVERERYTDPERVMAQTMKRVEEDEAFTDYVFARMGIDPTASDAADTTANAADTEAEQPQLSEREEEWLRMLIARETGEVADKIQDQMMAEYRAEAAPKSVLDYIGSKALHENFMATLAEAAIRRAANSSGMRQQLRAMASEEFGKNAGWWTRMAGGAAPFAVDLLSGGFAVPAAVGNAVAKGGMNLAARQVVKRATDRAVANGVARSTAEQIAKKAGTEAAQRYLATQAPILNVALRAMGGATNFATYDVQRELARQMGKGEFSPVDIIKEAVHGAVLGGAMGVAGGAIGQSTSKSGALGKALGNVAGVGAETGIFAASAGLQQAMDDGIPITDVDWADVTGESLGMVLGMKAAGAATQALSKKGREELRNRWRKAPDYDLKLNQHNIDELKAAGYDLESIFKVQALGDFVNVNVGEESQKPRSSRGEDFLFDQEIYGKAIKDMNVSSDTKRKLAYLANGVIARPEPVFGADITVNDDGSAVITTYNAKGELIKVEDFDSEEAAREAYEQRGKEARLNTIAGLERIYDIFAQVNKGSKDYQGYAYRTAVEETGKDIVDAIREGDVETMDVYIGHLMSAVEDLQTEYRVKLAHDAAEHDGYEMGAEDVPPADVHDVDMEYERARERVVSILGERHIGVIDGMNTSDVAHYYRSLVDNELNNEAQTLLDYVNAKARRDGLIQRVRDDIDSRIAASDAEVDSRTNKQGMVQKAVLKNNEEVYLVDGTVVMMPDGSGVDIEASKEANGGDGMVMVVGADGEMRAADIGEVLRLDEAISAREEKEAAANVIRNEMAQAAVDKMNGKVPELQPGDMLNLTDGEGRPVTVNIQGRNEDGTYQAIVNGNFFEAVDLQALSDEYAAQRAQRREQEAVVKGAASDAAGTGTGVPATESQGAVGQVEGGLDNAGGEAGLDTTGADDPSAATLSDAMPMIGEGDDAEPDFGRVEPARARKYIYEESGLEQEDADRFVDVKLKEAKAKQTNGKKRPEFGEKGIGSNMAKFKRAREAWQAEVDAAQAQVDYWQAVKDAQSHASGMDLFDESEKFSQEMQQAQRDLAGDREALRMLTDHQPRSLDELAARMLSGGMKLMANDEEVNGTLHKGALSHTGFSREDVKRMPFLFASHDKGGVSMDEFAHMLIEDAKADGIRVDESDPNEGLNVIVDLLSSVERQGDLNHYIERKRIAEARQYHAEMERQREAFEADEREKEQAAAGQGMEAATESPQTIQGLEGYTEDDVKKIVNDHVRAILNEIDADDEVVDIKVIGSRVNGAAREDSDLDVLVEYKGGSREDDLFNALNDEDSRLYIEGIPVDINPITKGKSGTIEEFLARNKDYQKDGVSGGSIDIVPEPEGKQNGTAPLQNAISVGKGNGISGTEQEKTEKSSTSAKIQEEEAKVNTEPTEGQKEAGNYKMGHVKVDGFDVTIENPKGSVRRGTDASGKAWEQEMHNTYGYIRGTEGVDGDHIDVFLSDHPEQGDVFVVDQVNKDGSFDEHKVMYGFTSAEEAQQAYLSNYEAGWQGLGAITHVSKEEFKKWIDSSHRKTKPFAEYKSVAALEEPASDAAGTTAGAPATESQGAVGQGLNEQIKRQKELVRELAKTGAQIRALLKLPRNMSVAEFQYVTKRYDVEDWRSVRDFESEFGLYGEGVEVLGELQRLFDKRSSLQKEKRDVDNSISKQRSVGSGYNAKPFAPADADMPLAFEPVEVYRSKDGKEIAYQSLLFDEDGTPATESQGAVGGQKDARASVGGRKDARSAVASMSDDELLQAIGSGEERDRGFHIDEYDKRHKQEYDDAVPSYAQMLEKDVIDGKGFDELLDNAYGMYGDVSRRWRDGGYASSERTSLRAQMDALEAFIDHVESEKYDMEREEEDALEEARQQALKSLYEDQKAKAAEIGFNLAGIRLRPLKKGEESYVERRYEENKMFSFTGSEKIKSPADVAYIFKQLETSSVENCFLVLLKKGQPTIIHLGMGNYASAPAPIEQAMVAYQELKPERVVFVHNHPSGVLKASREDKSMLARVVKAFGDGIVTPGIIIDTTSGKYGEFDTYDNWESERPSSAENEVPLKVYNFSKQVFAEGWNPQEAFKCDSSARVAEFISSHRLGKHKKMSLLVLNIQGRVVGNVFLPWTSMSEMMDKTAKGKQIKEEMKRLDSASRLMSGYINQMGGVRGILYGNYDYDKDILGFLNSSMRSMGTPLMDVLHIMDNDYDSAHEHGAMESMPAESAWVGEPVTDEAEIDRLDSQPVEVGYRNVALQPDGSMRSPMADKLGKKGSEKVATSGFEFGRWERSDEHPELATDDGKIDLGKPNGLGTVGNVDYNPYIHIRPTTLNKQFKNAWQRPELVYVETQYPKSELEGGYQAEKSKKPVGLHDWNGGQLVLSRWDKPVRIVPWEEVADEWEKEFKDRGVEFDIVPPALLPILAERGVEILPPHNGMGKDCRDAYETWKNGGAAGVVKEDEYFSDGIKPEGDDPNEDPRYSLGGVYYSNAERAVEGIKQEKATPEQWLAMIEKGGGLKAGEDKWLGLSEWLRDGGKDDAGKPRRTLTKQEVLEYIRQNEIQIEEEEYAENPAGFEELKAEYDKWLHDEGYDYAWEQLRERFGDDAEIAFGDVGGELVIDNGDAAASLLGSEKGINDTRLSYTTEGLDNKREIALVVPTVEPWNENDEIHFGDAGNGRAVAWVRFGETRDKDGKRVLVIDEIQSKRHQEGREKGYKSKRNEELRKKYSEANDNLFAYEEALSEKYADTSEWWKIATPEELQERQRLTDARDKAMEAYAEVSYKEGSIPDAPFEKNWHELAMKRMLRYAAENGYDKVAWTKGVQQAERYDMSNQVDAINTTRLTDGRYEVEGVKDGERVFGEYLKPEELPDAVGKTMAEKIVNGADDQNFEGDDLRIGGHGMEGFYDEMLPRFMNKYGKKWNAKVGEVELPDLGDQTYRLNSKGKMQRGLTMWSVDVTPEMKESVLQGQPMFTRAGSRVGKPTEIDKAFVEGLNEAMLGGGNKVVAVTEEGQRMLDLVNGRVKAMSGGEMSERRKEREGTNRAIDEATAFVTGKDVKDVRRERIERDEERRARTAEIYQNILSGNFDDVSLQQINDYINDVTPNNPYGRRLSERLPQRVERELYARERSCAIDVLFSRASESSVAPNERVSASGRRKIEERKKAALEQWAKATGNWHTDLNEFTDGTRLISDDTTDSDVYLSKDGQHVIKLSRGKQGKRFAPDIDNIPLFNYVFRNSAYKILGYGDFGKGFVRILEQPYVDFSVSTPLTEEERVQYMSSLGFHPINDKKTAFSNGEIVVADLQKNNIVRDVNGNIRVIDADCKLHTKDVGGNYTYLPVEHDLPAKNPIRFFRTPNGEAYGFVLNGTIYIDPRIAKPDTPIHEFTHLWVPALRDANPQAWDRMKEVLRDETETLDYVKGLYPDIEDEDELLEEVFAHYSGKRGRDRLNRQMRAEMRKANGIFEKAMVSRVFDTIRALLDRFWQMARDLFAGKVKGLEKRSLNDFADMALNDLLRGFKPERRRGASSKIRDVNRDVDVMNERFNEKLSGLKEENADRVVLSLGNPSEVLLAAGVEDKPMNLYGNKVIKKMKKHGFGLDTLRDLPRAVASPIAVFNNYGVEGNRAILTELRTEHGNILVTVTLGKGDMDIDFNVVSSVFGKSDSKIVEWINKGFTTYIDKEKALNYLHHSAPIAEALRSPRLISAAKVVEEFENPKLLEQKNVDDSENNTDRLRYQFVGERGAAEADRAEGVVTRTEGLALAKKMEGEGKDAHQIKLATGWERGKDGKWRYETSDDLPAVSKRLDALVQRSRDEVASLEKKADAFLTRGNQIDASLPKRITDRYSEEEKARFTELRKKRDELFKEWQKAQRVHSKKRDELEQDGIKTTLGEVLGDGHELFKFYPDMKDMPVTISERLGASGEYNNGEITLRMRYGMGSTLLHEVQHAIQSKEDFARGGNIGSILEDMEVRDAFISDLRRDLADVESRLQEVREQQSSDAAVSTLASERGMSEDDARAYLDAEEARLLLKENHLNHLFEMLENENMTREKAFEYYQRIAGEVESRNVQRRAGMSADERRASLAEETEDYSRDAQIVTYDEGGRSAEEDLGGETAEHTDGGGDGEREGGDGEHDGEREGGFGGRDGDDGERGGGFGEHFGEHEGDDGGEMPDVDAGHETLDEVLAHQMARLAETHKDNLQLRIDAMHEIGGNLAKLRKAMSAQRTYDRETVNAIVRQSKALMDTFGIDRLTRGETKKLLGLIAGAAGKEDIMKSANAVLDAMTKHHLRSLEGLLNKQLSVRASKVDAKGVKVQGQLDIEGQRMIAAAREGMGMDKDRLNERIADVMDRMGSDDAVTSKNAATELAGLQIAKQYLEEIKESQDEEEDLKRELEDAREARKAARKAEREGTASDSTGTASDTAGMAARAVSLGREAWREYVEATEEAIHENHIERIQSYYRLLESLGGGIAESAKKAKEWQDAQIARVREIQHNANSDMKGMNGTITKKVTPKQELVNAAQIVMAPMATFDMLMREFGRAFPDGEGYLFDRYVRGYIQAQDKFFKFFMAGMNAINDKIAEIFGLSKDKGVKDIQTLRELTAKLPKITATWIKGTHELSQIQSLLIYLTDGMAAGRMKLRGMDFDKAEVDRIVGEIDPRYITFADWVVHDFLPELRKEYNAVYERMFGAPMTAIENYFPLTFTDTSFLKSKGDIGEPDRLDQRPSTVTGSVMERTRNSTPLDILNNDALSVLVQNLQDMAHWMAFAEINRDLNTLMNYKPFENRVKNMNTVRYGGGDVLWKNLRNTAQIVAGVYQPKQGYVNNVSAKITKGLATANIAVRLHTALKQLQSGIVYTTQANWKDIGDAMAHPVETWRWAIEHLPTFAERWLGRKAGDPILRDADIDLGWSYNRKKWADTLTRWGLTPNAAVDALTVATGARAIYLTKKRNYQLMGYPELIADKRAREDAAISVNETQQSSIGAFVSPMQMDNDDISRWLSRYRNASMGFERQFMLGLQGVVDSTSKEWREEAQGRLEKKLLRDGLTEENAKRFAERAVKRNIWRNIGRVAMFGFIGPATWAAVGGLLPYLLYSIGGGDDDGKLNEYLMQSVSHAVTGPFEGLAAGDILASLVEQLLFTGKSWSELQIGEDLIRGDIDDIKRKLSSKPYEAAYDLFNMGFAICTGVSPQTVIDGVVSIIDASQGNFTLAREGLMLWGRLLNAPQSVLDNMYIEEIGMYGRNGKKLSAKDVMERYVRYKRRRGAGLLSAISSEESDAEVEDKYKKRFDRMLREYLDAKTDDELDAIVAGDDEYMQKIAESVAKKRYTEVFQAMDEKELSDAYDKEKDVKKKRLIGDAIDKKATSEAGVYGVRDTWEDKPSDSWKEETRKAYDSYVRNRTAADKSEDLGLLIGKARAKESKNEVWEEKYDDVIKALREYIKGTDFENREADAMDEIRAERERLKKYFGVAD